MGIKITNKNRLSTQCPDVAKEWHPDKNGMLTPNDVAVKSSKKVYWLCSKGHTYPAWIYHRTEGEGCPYCANRKLLVGYNDLKTILPALAEEWDYEANNGLKPEDVIYSTTKDYHWIGQCGHKWSASPYRRMRGDGCPQCSKEHHTSFIEQAIFYYVRQFFPDAINSYRCEALRPYELDVFIPSLNIGIEYDGAKWHKDLRRDLEKNDVCYKNDIKLIRVREKKCPPISPHDNLILINHVDIEDTISKVLNTLTNKNVKIELKDDYTAIQSQYICKIKANSFASKHPELAEEWDHEHNGSVKPDMVYEWSKTKYYWLCSEGHSYLSSPHDRAKGNNCSICSGHVVKEGINDIFTKYPELEQDWDYSKNTESPKTISYGSDARVHWKCHTCGHEWLTKVYNRTTLGHNCPECRKRHDYKKVLQVETGTVFESVTQAAERTNLDRRHISAVCNGKRKTTGGFHWQYIE